MSFVEPFVGTEGGPPSANAFKRAVYRQAPLEFSLEILPSQKQGGNFSYGMRIYPLKRENDLRSTRSSMTGGSSSSMSEYEIWRRWEDCLHFQDTLETLYTQMAREKRARLLAGKGVKKDGVYIHEDPLRRHHRASSFESLPPGPDPHMIAKDLHEVLPKLTKKGTLFRASAATVEQRQQEFTALIEALWRNDDEVPALIQELRQMRIVRDFFGFWRRDKDRLEKEMVASGKGRPGSSNGSVASSKRNTSSSFSSMYFSASNLSLQLPVSSPIPPSPLSASAKAKAREDRASIRTDMSNGHHRVRQRANTSQGLTSQLMQSSASMDSASSASSSSGSTKAQQPPQRRVTDPRPGPSRQPPASAPAAGVTFTFTLHNSSDEDGEGYLSEMVETPASDQSPLTPRSAPPHAVSMAKLLEKGLAGNPHRDLTDEHRPLREPHVVVHELGEFEFDDEESELDIIAREHESFMQHTLDPLMESMEYGNGFDNEAGYKEYEESIIDSSLRRTAIPEEDEDEDEDEDIDDVTTNEIVILQSPVEEELVPTIHPVARRRNATIDARNNNRNGQVFLPGEDGRLSIMETLSIHNFSEATDAIPSANGKPRPSSTGSSVMTASRASSLKERRGSGSTIGTASDESWYSLASTMLKRSLSTTSKATHRISQVSTLSVPEEVTDGDEFIDTYYYNNHSQENGDETERVPTLTSSPSRELLRGGVSEPDQYPAPFRNRPAGQFHLPWSATSRPKSPAPSIMSTFSTATAATNVTAITTATGNPEDSLLVKAIFHDSIIAFRVDRFNTTLQDVRQKILDKFVAQQGVPLSNSFSMCYQKPRLVVQRPTGMTGRVRSNSLSSVGSTSVEGGYLRKIASQSEWADALAVGGNKLTIQLSDSSMST